MLGVRIDVSILVVESKYTAIHRRSDIEYIVLACQVKDVKCNKREAQNFPDIADVAPLQLQMFIT